MDVVWRLEEVSVKDVTENLQKSQAASYKTVQTMLRILEEKGYVKHSVSGRTYIYQPVVERTKARRAALNQLLSSFFEGSPQSLMVNLLDVDGMDAAELDQLMELVNKHSKRTGG